jgi:hypothetical protein
VLQRRWGLSSVLLPISFSYRNFTIIERKERVLDFLSRVLENIRCRAARLELFHASTVSISHAHRRLGFSTTCSSNSWPCLFS